MDTIIKVIGVILAAAGSAIVYSAGYIVKRLRLHEKYGSESETEMELDSENLRNYRITKASVNVKILGMLIALPGLILILIKFK
jgi:hypothetical protein